jgi:hypothetical protein
MEWDAIQSRPAVILVRQGASGNPECCDGVWQRLSTGGWTATDFNPSSIESEKRQYERQDKEFCYRSNFVRHPGDPGSTGRAR